MESRLRRQCWGCSSPTMGTATILGTVEELAPSLPICCRGLSPRQAQHWRWGGTGTSWGNGEVAKRVSRRVCLRAGGSAVSVPPSGHGGSGGVSAAMAGDDAMSGLASLCVLWGGRERDRSEGAQGAAALAGMCHSQHVAFPVASPQSCCWSNGNSEQILPHPPWSLRVGSQVWQ